MVVLALCRVDACAGRLRDVTPRSRAAAGGAAVLATIAVGTAVAASGVAGAPGPSLAFVLVSLFTGLMFGLAGALLIALRPGNALGPLLAVAGTALTLEFALREYAYRGLPGAAWTGWAGMTLDPFFFPVPLALLLLVFPDGRLPSPRWRPVAGLGIVVVVVIVAATAARPGPLHDESYDRDIAWGGVVPASVGDTLAGVVENATAVGLLILLAAVVNLLVRFVRGAADERQRLKPLAVAGSLAIVFLVVQQLPGLRTVGVGGFVVSVAIGFPVALAVGALRYRVWDLDRVLVAAIVYGTLTVLVTAVYVGTVVTLGRLVEPGLLPTVLATALVAVLFAPVKERIGRAARRLVLGVRASPYAALAALPHQLAEAPVAADVLPRTARALTEGLGVPVARVRAFGADEVAWYPAPSSDDGLVVVPVRHLGEPVGDVAVRPSPDRPLSTDDRRLLADLAAQAGPALRGVILADQLAVRLRELTTRSAELQASRQRIVAAQAAERRRLERDIHDGVQQHMVALAMSLEVASDDPGALGACREHLDRCLADLRDLARGIYPPVLATRGLAAAVRARARLAAAEVRVVAADGVDGVRFGENVELAAYFAVLEALQNAAKHAPGAPVVVDLSAAGGWLSVTVRDDGPGFDPAGQADGTGLLGLADRVGAVGGALTIDARPGRGTAIHCRLPF
jgi:signal transduction histidine kinase